MAQKELVFKLKFVDENGSVVEKTAQNLNEINKSIADLTDELENTDLGSDQWNDLAKDLANAEDALEKTSSAIEETKNQQKGLGAQLSNAPGPIGGVVKGIKGMGTAFKALLANPVVAVIAAIVAGLTLLFKAFTSTKGGAEKFEQVMAGVGAVMDVLRDRVLKIGGAILKFFSGDFKGAAEDAKAAFSGMGAEIAAEFQAAADATAVLQRVEDDMRKLNVQRAKQNALISDAKLVINDENKSYEERLKALEEVREAEVALAEQERKLAEERYNALKALADLSDSTKEQLDELAAAEAEMYAKQEQSKNKQKELFDQEKSLRDRARAERKAAQKERMDALATYEDMREQFLLRQIEDEEAQAIKSVEIDAEKQKKAINMLKITGEKKKELLALLETETEQQISDIQKTYQDQRDQEAQTRRETEQADKLKELDTYIALEEMKRDADGVLREEELENLEEFLQEKMEIELENLDLSEEEKALIIANYEEQITQIKKDNADAQNAIGTKKAEIEKKNAEVAIGALTAVSQLAGESTLLGKATAVAAATVQTYLAAQSAYASQLIPGDPSSPVRATIAAAVAVAAGLANIAQIVAVQPPESDLQKPSLAQGGMVIGPGTGTSDSIPANLSNGESVINANSTRAFRPLLSAINQAGGGRGFANGGIASPTRVSNDEQLLSTIANQSQTPIKTYVVAGDVSTQQSLDRQIKSRSTI